MAYVKPPADEARRVGNRVLYELEMMAGLVERMDRFDELLRAELPDNELVRDLLDAAGRNADIESFALHARAMWAFLFGPKRRPDDVIARDFFETDGDWRGARLAKPVELDGLPDRVIARSRI